MLAPGLGRAAHSARRQELLERGPQSCRLTGWGAATDQGLCSCRPLTGEGTCGGACHPVEAVAGLSTRPAEDKVDGRPQDRTSQAALAQREQGPLCLPSSPPKDTAVLCTVPQVARAHLVSLQVFRLCFSKCTIFNPQRISEQFCSWKSVGV